MSITTFSKFYYGHQITSMNRNIDFDEGAAELTAVLDIGEYTLTEFVDELERALNVAGALTYTVTVARATRIITIAATGNFTLRTASGSHAGTTAFTVAGFTGANRTGAATYAGDTASGSVYAPQYKLQDYVAAEEFRRALMSSVNETVSGDVEVVSFSNLDMIEMNIKFCTNIGQPTVGPITFNPTGLSDVNTFMRYLIGKSPVEFMPDSATPATFHKVILESTTESKDGVGYKMKERTDLNLRGYYDTEKLVFRVLE